MTHGDASQARIAAAVAGDVDAKTSVLRQLHPRIRNVTHYLASKHPDVEDFAQLALIEVARALPSYRGEGRIERWTDRIVTRTVMAQLKRRRLPTLSIDTPTSPEPEGSLLDPAQQEDRRRLRQRLAHHFAQIRPERREVLTLRLILGHAVKEIAEITGAPLETVRTRLRVGKAELVAMLKADPQMDVGFIKRAASASKEEN